MSTTATATETTGTEHKCSCGRTFAHEISLKRHRWVTGHAEAEVVEAAVEAPKAAAAAPTAAASMQVPGMTPVQTTFAPAISEFSADVACQQAMQILLAKQQEQQEFDRRLAAQARIDAVGEFIDWVGDGAANAAQATAATCREAAVAGARGLRLAFQAALLLVILAGLLLTGIGVGRIAAARADAAPTVSVVQSAHSAHQLLGAR